MENTLKENKMNIFHMIIGAGITIIIISALSGFFGLIFLTMKEIINYLSQNDPDWSLYIIMGILLGLIISIIGIMGSIIFNQIKKNPIKNEKV
jgi:uncharacterized protein YneF (UPF0154 family)